MLLFVLALGCTAKQQPSAEERQRRQMIYAAVKGSVELAHQLRDEFTERAQAWIKSYESAPPAEREKVEQLRTELADTAAKIESSIRELEARELDARRAVPAGDDEGLWKAATDANAALESLQREVEAIDAKLGPGKPERV
jgi:hypothetical protein